MPTYQYVCTECRSDLEAVQSFTDDPLTECPTCGGRLRKVFNSVGIVFKGSGFYRNDSREKPKDSAPAGGKTEKGNTESGEKSGSKGESKTETKSEAKPSSGSHNNTSAKEGSTNSAAKKPGAASSTAGSAA